MLKDINVQFTMGNDIALGAKGVALVWTIDGDCLYDIPVFEEYVDMFTSSDEVLDVSDEYPDHDGITVRFMKNGAAVEDFQTSEYFGNILLSDPLVLDINDYPYGRYIQSPHAKFDGEKFIITNRDVTGFDPWHPKNPKSPAYNPNFGHNH
jgi:hypothetical protein